QHEECHAQLVGEHIVVLIAGPALQRLEQRFLGRVQSLIGIGDWPFGSLASAMVGGLSGMAVNCQGTSLAAAPRTVAAPASLMTKRRSSVPFAVLLCAPAAGAASPPPATTPGGIPGRRTTSALPAGAARAGAVCPGSPGRKPGRITGGRPV